MLSIEQARAAFQNAIPRLRDEFEDRIDQARLSGQFPSQAAVAENVLRLAGAEMRTRAKLASFRVKQLLDSGWRPEFENGVTSAFLDMYSGYDHWRKEASKDLYVIVERSLSPVPISERLSPAHPALRLGEIQVESSNEEMADLVCYAAVLDSQLPAQKLPPPEVVMRNVHPERDVFVSHASEDKPEFVAPLVAGMIAAGLSVWYDDYEITLGDVLTQRIDEGLSSSRYGVVVLSPAFFAKDFPRAELDALTNRELSGGAKVLLPIWHGVSHAEVARYSPLLASKLAAKSSEGVPALVRRIVAEVKRGIATNAN